MGWRELFRRRRDRPLSGEAPPGGRTGDRAPGGQEGERPPLGEGASSRAERREGLRLRLVDLDSLPSVGGLAHIRPLAPSLVEILTYDLPDAVVTPPGSELADLGSVEELVAIGRRNLRRLLDDVGHAIEVRRIRTAEGLSFTAVLGDSYYTASLALVLPDLLARAEPGVDLAKGVFVAVPNRHHLAWHVTCDLASCMSVGPMAGFARNGYDEGPGPVSPHVYWARGDRLHDWQQMTTHHGDEIAITVSAELTALIEDD